MATLAQSGRTLLKSAASFQQLTSKYHVGEFLRKFGGCKSYWKWDVHPPIFLKIIQNYQYHPCYENLFILCFTL